MSSLFSRITLAMLAMLVLVASQRQAAAQTDMEMQPGIIISMAPLNKHLGDVEHLVEAAGFGQMKGLVRMGSAEYIRGINADKPMGAMLFFEGDNPEPEVLGFLPVEDIDDVLDTIAQFVDIDDSGDDIFLTTDDGTELTVRVQDGYAFIAQDDSVLDVLPADPANLLEELPNEYNLAARIFGQRIPEELRSTMVDLIRQGAAESTIPGADGPMAKLQQRNLEISMKQIESLINNTDEVVAGLNVDQENKRIYIDVKFVGTPDSLLAQQAAAMATAPATRFAGFLLDDAAFNFHYTGKMLEQDVSQVQGLLNDAKQTMTAEMEKGVKNGAMSEDQAESAGRIVGDLIDVVSESIKGGVMDVAAVVTFDDNSPALAAGMKMAGGDKLEDAARQLAKIAEAEKAPVEFRFDTVTEDGIRYHEVDILIPENEEEARKILGDRVSLLLGVGDDVLYLAAGKSGKELLEKCKRGSAKGEKLPAMQANMHLLPFLRFLAEAQDAAELNMIADALPDEADDRMRMTVKFIDNGQLIRMEMEDGILEVFGKVGQSMGGGFAPPQDFRP